MSALIVLAGALVALGTAPATAEDSGFAPLERPGPALTVSAADLASAVKCSGDFHANDLEPVLLDPATAVTPDQNYSWNWETAFTSQGRPWCSVTEPFHTLGDLQTGGEYITYAIRHIYALAGRKVAVLGHSQGGMSMRWALRFWPDTRAMVDDVIGMAGDNHGTTLLDPICVEGVTTCTPQGWQQRSNSNFIRALNSGAETFAGISYTEIYSHTDEVVLPSTGAHPSSALTTGDGRITNVATQSICPLDVDEHLLMGTIDPVTYAIGMDALDHDGPAKPSRVSRAVCAQAVMPGVNPVDLANDVRALQLVAGLPNVLLVPVPFINLVGAPQTTSEPALSCYVYATGC
jgi:pimeloyl-ACP methyl ester carboxylesterase